MYYKQPSNSDHFATVNVKIYENTSVDQQLALNVQIKLLT